MLQKIRERLSLALIGLLPFHALLVTVLTRMIAGAGHAPLNYLAVWKEGVLGLILLIACLEIAMTLTEKKWKQNLRLDVVDGLILALIVLAICTAIINYQLSIINFVYGFKYDFLPLIAFVILRRVQWSETFRSRVVWLLSGIGVVIAIYGVLTALLPASFFTALGYSDLHSLYIPGGPLAAFQQIGESSIRRIQSVMSGPNQLGAWLLIPLSIGLISLSRRKAMGYWTLVTSLILFALFLTFSRAAWIAASVMAVALLALSLPKRLFIRAGISLVCAGIIAVVLATIVAPSVLVRLGSTRGHLEKPLQAIAIIAEHPLGLGLGTAGPASNATSDTCVMLRPEDDPSWAKAHPQLCVFLGDTQVQPENRVCHCPLLTENWYLQIGVELGVTGFGLYVLLIVLLLIKLRARFRQSAFPAAVFLGFAGICTASILLHSWEDAAVAYSLWILLAACLPRSAAE